MPKLRNQHKMADFGVHRKMYTPVSPPWGYVLAFALPNAAKLSFGISSISRPQPPLLSPPPLLRFKELPLGVSWVSCG